ncbi:DUF3795 domain-containing protein [bacterium]|nr:DUF3795 domain-containing protein [bacterium]
MTIQNELLSPCGLYCGVCAIYIADKENNQKFKEKLAPVYAVKPEELQCKGCMSQDEDSIFFYCKICPIKTCAKEKGFEGCYQCDDFPCDHIDKFSIPVGKKVILRAIPQWKELGTQEWVKQEEERYTCPKCGNKLFRGAKRCNQCKESVDLD